MAISKSDIPLEKRIWVDLETAAAILQVSPNYFRESVRYDQRFLDLKVESDLGIARFSMDNLRKYGNGELPERRKR